MNLARFPGFLRILGVGATGLLLAVACGQGAGGQQSQNLAADQTLKFSIGDDFGSLDPAQVNAETDSEIAQNVFNGLVKFDKNLNVVPDVAASMPTISSDQLTYTFKLRSDVTFSNGDKVTSKDVVYSWNRAAATQGPYALNLSAIAGYDKITSGKPPTPAVLEQLLAKNDPSVMMSGLSAPDDTTVVVKLAQPAGWFLPAIALESTTGMIVDQKMVQKDPQNWWASPDTAIGTGAYKMSARTPGQSIEFQAVSSWWGSPKPVVKNVHLDIIKDPGSRETAYEQGKYDINGYGGYSNLQVADILRVKGSSSLSSQLLLQPKVRTTWVSFNLDCGDGRAAAGPFCDQGGSAAKDLRMAFALAVDKTKLVNVACSNVVCTPASGGLITKGLKGYLGDNQDPLVKFDASQAKTLLKSADPDGTKTKGLTYVYDPENPLNGQVGQFLQDQWQTNLGVHVDLQPESHSQFIKDRLAGKFVLSRDGWQADYDHPQDWYDNLYGKLAGCPKTNCTSGYNNDKFNSLAAEADAKPLSDALPTYKQMSQMLISDAAYIPLYYSVGAFMIKPYVKGAGSNNFFDYYWNWIQILQH
jgi:oligopeptide transport system substrate-binding protein